MRAFMAITGHKTDREMTPVQDFELAQMARARATLLQLAKDQEAHYVVEAAEAHVRKLDDELAGRTTLVQSTARH
jgi:hypothetical protein